MASRYRDRAAAGRLLADAVAAHLATLDTSGGVVVLGLPRGGVPVAAPVAARLGADLDLLAVRKVGAPGHVELAIGAIASGGLLVRNDDVIATLGLGEDAVAARVEIARQELDAQDRHLRGHRPRPVLTDRTVVVVDDGLATGATMRAAVGALRTAAPRRVVVAVPVGPPDTCAELAAVADVVVCLRRPDGFEAVGKWYRDFTATTDREVLALLDAR